MITGNARVGFIPDALKAERMFALLKAESLAFLYTSKKHSLVNT
jgi:hypothetical protein